jgi:membrane-associated phospholipid phosphatase
MYKFTQILTSSPLTLYLIFIFISLITFDMQYFVFLVLFFIFGIILNVCLKRIIKQGRPSGHGTCGLYDDLYKNYTYGMPSMHSQIWSIFTLFWTIYILRNVNTSSYKKIIPIFIFWLLLLVICYQRVNSNCHTLLQVIIGCIIGFISALVMYKICMCVLPQSYS